MKKILIAGCGGAPSEGVVNSLLSCDKKDKIIGMGSDPSDLILSNAKEKYYVPYAGESNYEYELLKILRKTKPDLVHFQNDKEIFEASKIRDKIISTGTQLYMPTHDVIDTCVDKYKSYLKWKAAGLRTAENILINNEKDLKKAFNNLGDTNGNIWLRASSIGGGGKGALPTNDFDFAKKWIERYNGWGDFVGAELLTANTVTWLSIWNNGELVVAQTRIRKGWVHGNRTLSGVTGVTKVGQTYSDKVVDSVALDAIKAIDVKPHGIYGVDMAYSFNGDPIPTEINISRFFTTILFFTKAGLNMPKIFKDIILYNEFPSIDKKINPLPDGLMWLRGMDKEPRIIHENEFEKEFITL